MKRVPILVERKMLTNLSNPYGYIYITTNLINHKKYIGQHKSKEYDKNYYGSGDALLKAIEKYGKKHFVVEIIDWSDNKQDLDNKEIYWIKILDAVNSPYYYNMSPGGGVVSLVGELNPMYNKTHSMKTRKIISEKNKVYAKNHVEEIQSRIAKATEVNKNKQISEETRQKLRNSCLGELNSMYNKPTWNAGSYKNNFTPPKHHRHDNTTKVVQLSIDGQFIREFNSVSEPFELGVVTVAPSGISSCCRGKQNTAGGFKWKYSKDYY